METGISILHSFDFKVSNPIDRSNGIGQFLSKTQFMNFFIYEKPKPKPYTIKVIIF